MKFFKHIIFFLLVLLLSSCGSIYSNLGNDTKKITSKCTDCFPTRNYYKSYGEAEIVSGPRVTMATISQARTSARNEMVKMLGTEGMSIAAQIQETKTNNDDMPFRQNMTEAFKEQAYAMLQNTEEDCIETRTINYKGKKGQEFVKTTVCIKMSKKEYADNIYRKNKEMFSKADIDYNTFSIMLSGSVEDK